MLGNRSFHSDNHCFGKVQQIAGLLEHIFHQNVLVSKSTLYGF